MMSLCLNFLVRNYVYFPSLHTFLKADSAVRSPVKDAAGVCISAYDAAVCRSAVSARTREPS